MMLRLQVIAALYVCAECWINRPGLCCNSGYTPWLTLFEFMHTTSVVILHHQRHAWAVVTGALHLAARADNAAGLSARLCFLDRLC